MAQILVVDDEEQIRFLIRTALEAEGHTVADAENGRDAIHMVEDLDPDLIVSDIQMEGMSGYEFLEQIRCVPDGRQTPFIFITGDGGRDTFRKGMERGADDFLPKPFTQEELLASVRARLRAREVLKRESERKVEDLRQSISLALPHEFRTPLNAVLAFSRILSEDTHVAPDEGRKFAGMIHQAGERLHHLVENYLAYSQIELSAADPETLRQLREQCTPHVRTVIQSCARDKAQEYDRMNDVRIHAESGCVCISHEHLSKILTELIDNAFKFSSKGNVVHVTGTPVDGAYTIVIEDSGRGMTKEQMRDVDFFQQFERKTHEQQGSGLGLAIARRLAELYEGIVLITSEPGKGTQVRLTLPPVGSAA